MRLHVILATPLLLAATAQSNPLDDALSLPLNVPALSLNGASVYPGAALRADGSRAGLVECIKDSGKKVQLAEGTGWRAEIIFNPNGGDVATLLRAIGITAPPATTDQTRSRPIRKTTRPAASDKYVIDSEPWLQLAKKLSGPELWFAILTTRDDGVFTYDGLKFDVAALANDVPGADRLQWVRQRCGALVAIAWREQARRITIFRSAARFQRPGAAFDPLAKELLTSQIFSLRPDSDQEDASGARIGEYQRNARGFGWLPERFWHELLGYGPIEITSIEIDSPTRSLINSRTVQSFDQARWVAEPSPDNDIRYKELRAWPTHVSVAPIDGFVPEFLKSTAPDSPEAGQLVELLQTIQLNSYAWLTNRARVLRMLDDVEQAVGAKEGSAPSVFVGVVPKHGAPATGSVLNHLQTLGVDLRKFDALNLDYLELARERFVEAARTAKPPKSYTAGYEGPNHLKGPSWSEMGITRAELGSQWPLPTQQIERVGTLWGGNCSKDPADSRSLLPLTNDALIRTLRAFAETTYKRGFIAATSNEDEEALLGVIGHTGMELVPLPSNKPKWDGKFYRFTFRPEPVRPQSDVLLLTRFDFPLDPSISANVRWTDSATGRERQVQMVPVVMQTRRRRQQGLVGLLPCVNMADMLTRNAIVTFGTPDGRRESMNLLWMLSEGTEPGAIPKWWREQVELTRLNSILGTPPNVAPR